MTTFSPGPDATRYFTRNYLCKGSLGHENMIKRIAWSSQCLNLISSSRNQFSFASNQILFGVCVWMSFSNVCVVFACDAIKCIIRWVKNRLLVFQSHECLCLYFSGGQKFPLVSCVFVRQRKGMKINKLFWKSLYLFRVCVLVWCSCVVFGWCFMSVCLVCSLVRVRVRVCMCVSWKSKWRKEVEHIGGRIPADCWQHWVSGQHWIGPSVGRVWIVRSRHWNPGVDYHRTCPLRDRRRQRIPDQCRRNHRMSRVHRSLHPIPSCCPRMEHQTWSCLVNQSPTWRHRSSPPLGHKRCTSGWTGNVIVPRSGVHSWTTWWPLTVSDSTACIRRELSDHRIRIQLH